MEDRLRKFSHLVETGSFTKAAEIMHISQPALTTSIQKLERELQTELLVRGGHSFKLTEAGAIAYETAKAMSMHTANLKLRLQEAATEKIALRLGMIDSIADLLFVQGNYLHELEQGTRLSLTVNNSVQLSQQVMQNELDIALVAEPAHIPSALTAEPLAEEPLLLVTSRTHKKQASDDLVRKHLKHFLAYNQSSQTYQLVERYFSRQGVRVESSFYSTSPEIMLQLLLAGKGVAVLPFLLIKPHLRSGELVVLKPIDEKRVISRQIVALSRTGRRVPSAAKTLLEATTLELQALGSEAAHRKSFYISR